MRTLHILLTLAIGILIGVCATLALYVVKPGPAAGDWLTFAGALVGVVLTVIATLIIEDLRKWSGTRRDLKVLSDTLGDVEQYIQQIKVPRGDLPLEDEVASRITIEAGLLKSLANFNFFRSYVPRQHVEAWDAVEKLSNQFERNRPTLETELGLLDDDTTEGILVVNINKTTQIAQRLSPLVEAAQMNVKAIKL